MQYDKTFKAEDVGLSDEIGVKKVAFQLDISYYTLSGWRQKRSEYGQSAFPGSGNNYILIDVKEQRIRDLEKEVNELKRSNEILQDAFSFFAVRRKK